MQVAVIANPSVFYTSQLSCRYGFIFFLFVYLKPWLIVGKKPCCSYNLLEELGLAVKVQEKSCFLF